MFGYVRCSVEVRTQEPYFCYTTKLSTNYFPFKAAKNINMFESKTREKTHSLTYNASSAITLLTLYC